MADAEDKGSPPAKTRKRESAERWPEFAMSAEELRVAINRLGLSQVAAANFLNTDPRSVRRWASSSSAIPGSVALSLALALHLVGKEGWSLNDVRALVSDVTSQG